MGVKKGKFFRIDEGLLNEFEKICSKKKAQQNIELEEILKQYIARDGEKLFDDLYAPRIQMAVQNAVEDQINRLAKMIYNVNVDATATLNSIPAIYKKQLKSFEETINTFINPQLLNPSRASQADHFDFNTDGQKLISNARKYARTDIQQRKNAKEETN